MKRELYKDYENNRLNFVCWKMAELWIIENLYLLTYKKSKTRITQSSLVRIEFGLKFWNRNTKMNKLVQKKFTECHFFETGNRIQKCVALSLQMDRRSQYDTEYTRMLSDSRKLTEI